MVVDEQHMLLSIHRQQPGSQQLAGPEIKRCAALLLLPCPDHLLRIPLPQRFRSQRNPCRGVNDLHHLAPVQAERAAQRGVTFDQGSQGTLQGGTIEFTLKPPQAWQVIGRELRLQLMQEPQPRLGGRRLKSQAIRRPVAGNGGSGGSDGGLVHRPLGSGSGGPQKGRQRGDGGVLEEGGQGRNTPEALGHAGHQPRRRQGVAAHQKEVVGDAEIAMTQHLSPEPMELALQVGRGLHTPLPIDPERRGWQGLAIELAVGCERQRLQLHKRRRHHVGRQSFAQEAPELLTDSNRCP